MVTKRSETSNSSIPILSYEGQLLNSTMHHIYRQPASGLGPPTQHLAASLQWTNRLKQDPTEVYPPHSEFIGHMASKQERELTGRGTHRTCESRTPAREAGDGANWRRGCETASGGERESRRGFIAAPVASPSASGTRGVEAGAHQRHDAPVTRIKTRLKRPETPAGSRTRTPRCATGEQVRRSRQGERGISYTSCGR